MASSKKTSTYIKKASSSDLVSLAAYTSVSRARLKSLYSDFSLQKQSNPAGYQSNIDWWKQTLFSLLTTARQPSSSDTLILHADASLVEGLRCEELGVGKPLGIASVLTELSGSGQVMPLTTFRSSSQSIYYPGSVPVRLASYLVGKPLWWALEQLNIIGESQESEEKRWKRVQGDYVVVPLLEKAADAVMESYRSKTHVSLADTVYDIQTFHAEFASKALPDVILSLADIKVLLNFLERDRQVVVTAKDVIKFVDEKSTEPSIVTQVDHGVLELKLAVEKLNYQIEDIQHQIEDRAEKIIEQLKHKRKEMAMSYLRSRKQLEDLLSKRLQSLETLQATLLQVENAAGNVEIMKAYETSTTTLKRLLSHPSLQRDKIEATMSALEDATADHEEIDEAIRLGGEGIAAATGTVIDDDEIEEEIQRMIEEKEREEAEKKEREAIEKAQLERKEREEEAEKEKKRAERRRRDEEERERKQALVESGRGTPISAEDDKVWEERWLAAQAEKAAQAQRDREAEKRRRAKWEEGDAQRAETA